MKTCKLHPGVPAIARELCRKCYANLWYTKQLQIRTKQFCMNHPDRLHQARGLCSSCYRKQIRQRFPERHKKYDIKSQYGLSWDKYVELIKQAGNCCEICKTPVIVRNLHIDHCHKTNIVRGLLCSQCNHGLGNFKDSIELLLQAVEYVKRAQEFK